MARLDHSTEPGLQPGSRTRRMIARVRTAVMRAGMGPVESSVSNASPVLRDYPYRVDR